MAATTIRGWAHQILLELDISCTGVTDETGRHVKPHRQACTLLCEQLVGFGMWTLENQRQAVEREKTTPPQAVGHAEVKCTS